MRKRKLTILIIIDLLKPSINGWPENIYKYQRYRIVRGAIVIYSFNKKMK